MGVDPALWSELSPLLDEALDLDATGRAEMLASVRQTSPNLAAALEQLLTESDSVLASRFLEASPDVTPAAVSLAGHTIGPYTLERRLGIGGMGSVWLARRSDGRFEGVVAVKLLNLALLDQAGQERFRREGTFLARLSHPNIARLLDAGVTATGQPYLVLEYIEGQRIDTFADERRLGVNERLRLLLGVLEAVSHAHSNLVVHRDLKPSNIVVTAGGVPKLLDFGIAKLLSEDSAQDRTLTGDIFALTPEFAAPEQVGGGAILPATDVYAIGVLLYLLLTGRRPYELVGRSASELERVVCEKIPVKPSIAIGVADSTPGDGLAAAAARSTTPARLRRRLRGDLDTIVMKALRKEAERRYPTASALEEDIRRYLEGRPVSARPDSVAYRVWKFTGRHHRSLAAAAVVLVALAGGMIRERALRARAEAEARKARAVEEYLVSVFEVSNPYAPPGARGDDVTARDLLDRGAIRIEASLSSEPDVQAELRGVLGNVYVNLGLLDAAEPLLRRALDQQRTLHGQRHPDVAAAMDRLGYLLVHKSRLDEAEPLLREALAQRRALLGNAHPDTALTIDHLATLLQERSEYDASEVLFREAVQLRERIHGREHEAVAASLNNLGLLLYMKAQYDQTARLYREAFAIYERRLGSDHPQTAETAQNLAQLLEGSGQFAEAETLYRRALAAKRKTLGNAHPSVTINLNNLANLLARYRGNLVEAEALAREALALDRQMFREPHAYVAESLRRVGSILQLKGDFEGADRHFREALAMNRVLFGVEHFRIALTLNQIGQTLHARGELRAAVDLFREALDQLHRLVGEQHLNYAAVSVNLAKALREEGRARDAEAVFASVVKRFDPPKRGQHDQFMAALIGVGLSATDQGRPAEAIPLIDRALGMSTERFGREHWRTAEAQLALAVALEAVGDKTRAQPLLREAASTLAPHRPSQPRLALQLDRALAKVDSQGTGR